MKRLIALLLSVSVFLTGCTSSVDTEVSQPTNTEQTSQTIIDIGLEPVSDSAMWEDVDVNQFTDLSDTDLLQYVEDNIYSELSLMFDSDNYIIDNITTAYISQEYLEEISYNSQANVFFGYTITELDEYFDGDRYVFALGDNGETVAQKMQIIEDTSVEDILKNVAIGAGVILICVTVSYFTAGTGTPTAINLVFTAAAKTGASFALSSGALGGISAGIIKGYETGDMDEALKAAATASSEGFMWGAIVGACSGGGAKALSIYRSSKVIPTPRESELKVLSMTDDGVEQISYLNGRRVDNFTQGATRPDVVVQNTNGTVKAIEVKNYNLQSYSCRNHLYSELERQVTDRVNNLPLGSTQEIVLDVRGRNYSTELIDHVKNSVVDHLSDIYPNIPVTILRY